MRTYLLCLCLGIGCWSFAQVACSIEQTEIVIEIKTDRYGYETFWSLTDNVGSTYGSTLPFSYKNKRLYRDTLCIPRNTCANFAMYDVFGDGMEPPGYYLVLLDGDTLVHGGNFLSKEVTHLQCHAEEICATGTAVGVGLHTAHFDDSWYEFTPDSSGIYRISTRGLNNCNTKIWVYGTCKGITIAEDNQSTVFFNDNATNQTDQAEVRGYFYTGKTYQIRIGDHENACPDSIRWSLTFEGILRGCLDPNACNYNPLATVDDGSCLPPGSRRCPKEPDLRIRQDTLLRSMYLDTIHSQDACLLAEGCLRGYGVRQVLRFTTQIDNIGERDYFIGVPSYTNPLFTWNNCHNHFHYDNYAEYIVMDAAGKQMPIGFKSGLCITDFGCEPGYNPKFSCENMGISAHCYDTYWSELKCQWIDVTELPDGKYTLVVRINWKNSPDALGQVEKNMDNNIAQACIRLDRSSGVLKCQIDPMCEPYFDCAGQRFGDTQFDCLGICGGEHLFGDVNDNGLQELADAENYIKLLLGNDLEANACMDLNADGAITVQDAVLLASCLQFGAAHPHVGTGAHNHCQFPTPPLSNPNDTVTLGITAINWTDKYLDISILNPSNAITAYQFRLSGGTISHVENLADENIFPITPRTNMSGGMVVAMSFRDATLHKSATMQPLCRIYFLNFNEKDIEIQNFIAINNHLEKVWTQVDTRFSIPRTIPKTPVPDNPWQTAIRPNPFAQEAQLFFSAPAASNIRLNIFDVNGNLVRQYLHVQASPVHIRRESLSAGIYFYKLISENGNVTGKLIIQ